MLTFLLAALAQCATVSYYLDITYSSVTVGNFTRRVIGSNNTYPIPALEAFFGDRLVLVITNSISEPIAIHSHGLFHKGTPYNDGAMGLTQCGIMPGNTFTYDMLIEQTGTFWVHGHNKGHYVDGLRTSLVLKPAANITAATAPAFRPTRDFVVGLQDFYVQEHSIMLEKYLNVFNPTGAEPIPDAALINHRLDQKYEVGVNETIKLRFISMTALSMFTVWIDDHEMTVVEIDGIDVEPYVVSSLSISAAQRYENSYNLYNNICHNHTLENIIYTFKNAKTVLTTLDMLYWSGLNQIVARTTILMLNLMQLCLMGHRQKWIESKQH